MSLNLLPLEEQFAHLLDLLATLKDEGGPEVLQPSYLWKLAVTAQERNDLPRDKVCRWLGYCYGVLAARDTASMNLFSFNEPAAHEDASEHPVLVASLDVLLGLKEIMKRADVAAEDTERPARETALAITMLQGLIDDTIDAAIAIGVNALSLRVGFIQGFMTAYSFLDVTEERNRTRPIFHQAYERLGTRPPASVAITVDESPSVSYDDATVKASAAAALSRYLAWANMGFWAGFFQTEHPSLMSGMRKLPCYSARIMVQEALTSDGEKPSPEVLEARLSFLEDLVSEMRSKELSGLDHYFKQRFIGTISLFVLMFAMLLIIAAVGVAETSIAVVAAACAFIMFSSAAFGFKRKSFARKHLLAAKQAESAGDPRFFIPWRTNDAQ